MEVTKIFMQINESHMYNRKKGMSEVGPEFFIETHTFTDAHRFSESAKRHEEIVTGE